MAKQITSLQHPYVKHLVHLHQNRDYRYDHQSVIIEGEKIISEVSKGYKIKTLLVVDESKIPPGLEADEVVVVTQPIMEKISGMRSSEGFAAEVAMPPFVAFNNARFVVALDGINDPGNLGGILRTALAFGWEGIFLLGDCCDPYNDKALRAARGATFKIPMQKGSWEAFQSLASALNVQPLAADVRGKELGPREKHAACLLVLGNEAHGVSAEAALHCEKITIPMSESMESLNVAVAGGILMYLLRR